jgi:homopolymeric O-antigen transport system permease protein
MPVKEGAVAVRVIRPRRGWRALDLRDLWAFRDLLLTLIIREMKLRYRQTALGTLWVVLQPILAGLVFAFVFGRVARLDVGGTPYFVFAVTGIIAWSAFGNGATRASVSLVQNSALITKVSFPRLVLPAASVIASLFDTLIAAGVLVIGVALYGIVPGPAILLLPVWLFFLSVLALGVGVIAAALMVTYRDVQYVVPVLLQLLFYATPVGYPVAAVPAELRVLVLTNPVSGLLEAARASVLGSSAPSYGAVVYSVGTVIILLVGAVFLFRSLERNFSDVI